MTLKRTRLIWAACVTVMAAMLVLVRCMPTEVLADLTMAGPPTIQEHLTAINSNLQYFKWMAGGFLALLVYVWKSTIANLKSSIGYVERKAEKAFDKAEEVDAKMDTEKDRVNRDFRAVQTCNERHGNGHN